jgi:uncharacterized membrane protein
MIPPLNRSDILGAGSACSMETEIMQRRTATTALYILVTALALTGVVIVLLRAVSLAQTILSGALPPAGSYDGNFARRPSLTLLHMVPGLIFVILGPLQFVTKIRTRYINFHRWCGRIYVASGLLVGVTALILGSVVAFGGATETAAITFFSTLFLIFLGLAVFRIRRREISAHREWMIRAFALGLAITTMRPMMAILIAFTGLSFSEILGISFWLAFSLHLVIAELWVKITRAAPPKMNTP